MRFQFFLCLSLAVFVAVLANAQEDPASNEAVIAESDSQNKIMNRLNFKAFEAVAGNIAICKEDSYCIENAKSIKSWVCAAEICSQKNSSKEPISCFESLNNYSIQQRLQVNSLICPAITTMNAKTRDELLAQVSILTKDSFMESTAYLLALRESAVSCENYIKEYLGAWGPPQWTLDWYRALSGCRILGKATTRQQEENDFYTWFKVSSGASKCSDITNSSMSQVCSSSIELPL